MNKTMKINRSQLKELIRKQIKKSYLREDHLNETLKTELTNTFSNIFGNELNFDWSEDYNGMGENTNAYITVKLKEEGIQKLNSTLTEMGYVATDAPEFLLSIKAAEPGHLEEI